MIVVKQSYLGEIYKLYKCKIVNSDIVIKFNDDGADLILGDTSNVMRCQIHLAPEWFDVYKPETEIVGFGISAIDNIVKNSSKESVVEFKFADADKKRISSTFMNGNAKYTVTFIKFSPSETNIIRSLPDKFFESLKPKWKVYNIEYEDFVGALNALCGYSDTIAKRICMTGNDEDKSLCMISGDVQDETGVLETKLNVSIVSAGDEIADKNEIVTNIGISFMEIVIRALGLISKDSELTTIPLRIGHNAPLWLCIPLHDESCYIDIVIAPQLPSE